MPKGSKKPQLLLCVCGHVMHLTASHLQCVRCHYAVSFAALARATKLALAKKTNQYLGHRGSVLVDDALQAVLEEFLRGFARGASMPSVERLPVVLGLRGTFRIIQWLREQSRAKQIHNEYFASLELTTDPADLDHRRELSQLGTRLKALCSASGELGTLGRATAQKGAPLSVREIKIVLQCTHHRAIRWQRQLRSATNVRAARTVDQQTIARPAARLVRAAIAPLEPALGQESPDAIERR